MHAQIVIAMLINDSGFMLRAQINDEARALGGKVAAGCRLRDGAAATLSGWLHLESVEKWQSRSHSDQIEPRPLVRLFVCHASLP